MNCLELRRFKLADPRHLPGAASEHLLSCEPCRGFARQVDEVDQRVTREVLVEVPDGLSDRMLLRLKPQLRPPLRLAALAALVVLTIALGLFRPAIDQTGVEAARIAIAHVTSEPESFSMWRDVQQGELVRVASGAGARLTGSLGTVKYLKNCPVPGGTGWHLVMTTKFGPVTLIIVPGWHLQHGGQVEADGWYARTRPAGRGYYVVVADSLAGVEEAERIVRSAVQWSL